MGGVGIVVERHKSVLLNDGLSPCQTFFATERCLLRQLHLSLTTLEGGLLVQRLQQLLVGLEVDTLDADRLDRFLFL